MLRTSSRYSPLWFYIACFIPALIGLSFFTTACNSDEVSQQQIEAESTIKLAEVGNYSISETHFKNMFDRFYQRTGRMQQINSQVLHSILDGEVNIYTTVLHAEEQGWDGDREAQYRHDKIRRKALMEEYERRYVHPDVHVTEDFLEELFVRLNTYLRASHIYAPDRHTADSLHQELLNGADFNQMAANHFEDQKLANNGGDIGYFTVDEMDVGFEFTAYDMEVGELSGPVRTSRGYSIIKLTDRITTPIMTEHEFATKKPKLRSMANEQLAEYERRNDIYATIEQMDMDKALLARVWDDVKSDLSGGINPVELEQNPFRAVSNDLYDQKLVDQQLLTLTVGDFIDEAFFGDSSSLQQMENFNQFEKFAEGIAFRSYALNKIMNSPKLHRQYVEATIDRTFHVYLNNRLNDTIRDTLTVAEEKIQQEFYNNRHHYKHPAELNLAEIAINEIDKAEYVYSKITEDGLDFTTALHEYGFDEEAKLYDGELGYIPINKFGGLSPALSDAEPGDVVGPFEMSDDVVFIFKVLGRRDSEPMTYNEARDQIEKNLMDEMVQTKRDRILRQTRTDHDVEVHYSKLRDIDLTL